MGVPRHTPSNPASVSVRNSLQYVIQHKTKYGDFAAQGKGHLAPSTALQIPIAQCNFIPRVRKVHTREKVLSAEFGSVNNIIDTDVMGSRKPKKKLSKATASPQSPQTGLRAGMLLR